MTTELATRDYLSVEQAQLLKDTFCKGATDDEFRLAVSQINRLRLDPFTRQIVFLKKMDRKLGREVMSLLITIDGQRCIAQRTGQYQGQTKPEWCGDDGKWREVWTERKPPSAARCGVYREGFREPLYAVARFASYAQRKYDGGLMRNWETMPDVMIHKCAEALALRRAFPQELSGLYTSEEMGAADGDDRTEYVKPPEQLHGATKPDDKLAEPQDQHTDSLQNVIDRIQEAITEEQLEAPDLIRAVKALPDGDRELAIAQGRAQRHLIRNGGVINDGDDGDHDSRELGFGQSAS